jgi:hypothetical protein
MPADVNEACRICGKDANDACSGCKDALYCSYECQKWDWKKGGHKALCRGPPENRKINHIIRNLFEAEWKWLNSLSTSEKTELFAERADGMPLNHFFLGGSVALVLAGANACAFCTGHYFTEEYGAAYFANVLTPWYTKHMDFLSEKGFFIEFISHEVYVADRPCSCRSYNGKPCGELYDLARGGAALVKNIRSPKIELVNKVFVEERPIFLKSWKGDGERVVVQDFLNCISFRRAHDKTNPETSSIIRYLFQYQKQVFPGEYVCCSPCLNVELPLDPGDANAMGEHFRKCHQSLAAVGFLVELCIVHVDDWSDEAFAEAFWAATGKEMHTFQKWITENNTPLSSQLGALGRRLNRVWSLVFAMDREAS